MSEDNKLYNLILVGPDTIDGHAPTERPDFALPEPGPDNEYFYSDELIAPGYKLGSYLNVYNFDDTINKILKCEDWSTHLQPKYREYYDGACMVYDIVGEEDYLAIESPDENNIPKNVCVLLQEGMLKGDLEPSSPNSKNRNHHYENIDELEQKRMGWWISSQLKQILIDDYGWKFFENIVLEDVISEEGVINQYVRGEWKGGIDKTLLDVQYHDINLAINDELSLANYVEKDSRATGERVDVLALFSYVTTDLAFTEVQATATLQGSCEEGFSTVIEWSAVEPFNPDIEVASYHIFSKRTDLTDAVLIQKIDASEQQQYSYTDSLDELETGVPGYPKYFISWKASEGSMSDQFDVPKLPVTFEQYGVPSCDGESITLEKSSFGECWTEEYGKVTFQWNISLPENTVINSLKFIKLIGDDRIEYDLETDVRTFVDEGVAYSEDSENSFDYFVRATVSSLALGEQILSVESDIVNHTTEECVCDDQPDICADKCWIRKESTASCSENTDIQPFNPELLVWMENYNEDPFSKIPSSSFDIKYCIADKCAQGIEDFSLRVKLPDTYSIISVESKFGEIDVYSDFNLGQTKNEWVIKCDSYSWDKAKPSFDTLFTVKMNKPLGTNRVEFVIGNDDCTAIVSEDGYNTSEYGWSNNAQNNSAPIKKWQVGPPLSTCTDEIDIGYGDYLLDLQAIDPKTVDVNFCLSRDDFDTFILVVLNTDFRTKIDSIDPIIGQAIDFGWDVTFRNIAPGMSVILGHGENSIPSSGYDTLLRMILDESAITRDRDACTCIFPFFLKLGGLWETIRSISENYSNTNPSNSYSLTASYSSSAVAALPYMMTTMATNNPVAAGLRSVADNIDPRFKEIVCCIHDAYVSYLEKAGTPNSGIKSSDLVQVTIMVQLFLMMITIFSSISIAKSSEINKKLDKIESLGNAVCSNYLMLEAQQPAENSDGEFDIIVKYSFPTSYISGVQFQVNVPQGFVIDRDGLKGDAKEKQFLQILGNNGAYMCVYDYALSNSQSTNASYLTSAPDDPRVLTRFKLRYVGDGTGEDNPPTLAEIKPILGIFDNTDNYIQAKLVTNDVRLNPTPRWNGDWYNVDQRQEVNVTDFLVACILTTGGEADLSIPDLVIVLPDDSPVSQKYFGGNAYDLSNITYETDTFFGRDDEGYQEYMLDFFDANGDGVTDVTDVVTIRNMFLLIGSTSISRKISRTVANIVPTEVCTINRSVDFEFYVPDECSDFCVKTRCFSKLWISDIISTPEGVLLEVSYGADCDGASLSGAQLTVQGLYREGIIACVSGEDGTLFEDKNWKYDIISSNRYSSTKDTVVAHARNQDSYADSGTGVLTYLLVKRSSIYGLSTDNDFYEAFMHTNATPIATTSATVANIGTARSSTMATLLSTYQTSQEVLAYQNFGIRISSQILTTNSVLLETSEDYDQSLDPDFLTKLITYNKYKNSFDSNDDSAIDVVDVQTAFHLQNASDFLEMTENRVVPNKCCPCDELSNFKLSVGDFNGNYVDGDGIPYFVLDGKSGWGKDRKYSVSELACDGKHEGGIILSWTPSDTAKFYIVYRRKKGSSGSAVPIIGSKVGVVSNVNGFASQQSNSVNSQLLRTPVQIASTVWVDFPPADHDKCCDWCLEDKECQPESVSIEYDYYVVAYNECGQKVSNLSSGAVPCCNFAPIVRDEVISVEANVSGESLKSYLGKFDVLTKGREDFYVYTNTASRTDKTEMGGKFEVNSGAPFSSETGQYGVANTPIYYYTPPVGFFGRDKINFRAVVRNRRVESWLDWCGADGEVNIFVYPPQINFKVQTGRCSDSDERHTGVIFAESIDGVEFYKVFRDGEVIDTIKTSDERFTYIDASISQTVNDNCRDNESTTVAYAIVPVFIYEGQEISPDPQYQKTVIGCCKEIENPDVYVKVKKDICDEHGQAQNGLVEIFWKDLGDFDHYGVYKRRNSNDQWVLIAKFDGDDLPGDDGLHRYEDKIRGCTGCGKIQYEYCVVTHTVSGSGEIGNNSKVIVFDCCQSKPKALDAEYVIEGGRALIDKKLRAFDLDADIVKYEILDYPPQESGTVYEFEPVIGSFSFMPKPLYEGVVLLRWRVTDSCGNTDDATITIDMRNAEICNEDDYVICNATISYLTDQQDAPQARIRVEDLPQVPFSLNNKGVPSLRRRCGAYSVTSSVDPSLFALPAEGCLFIDFADAVSFSIPKVRISCDEDIFFNSCKDVGTGIPAVAIDCSGTLVFNNCKPVLSDIFVSVDCDDSSVIFSVCSEQGGDGDIFVECDNPVVFAECQAEPDKENIVVELSCEPDTPFSTCQDEHGDINMGGVTSECDGSTEFCDDENDSE